MKRQMGEESASLIATVAHVEPDARVETIARHASTRPDEATIDTGAPDGMPHTRGVTFRVVVLSLLLAVFFGYMVPIIDVKLSNTFLGAAHLPPGAVAVLLAVLVILNPLLGLASEKWALSRNEALTLYMTCLFSCLVPGHGAENFFITNIIGPFYYATPENGWLKMMQPYLQHWFTPALDAQGNYNEAVIGGWYTGLRPDETIPWGAWLLPLATWSALILASYFMMACLGVILRRQWAENEALAFPLLRLPLEMTEDMDAPRGERSAFFRNPLMWAGFAVAVVVQALNGLHLYFPDVPMVPMSLNLDAILDASGPPLNQIDWAVLQVYLAAIGITYLLTTEISFSLWFFFWLIRSQSIIAYSLGFMPDAMPWMAGHITAGRPFNGYQQLGAYLAYSVIVLWLARKHLGYVVRRSLPLRQRVLADESEKHEAMSYPVAFWGFLLCFGFLLVWTTAAGARLDAALVFWFSYLAIAISLTRVVVEGGLLFVQQGWTPLGAMAQLTHAGTGTWLAPQSAAPLAFIQSSMVTDMRAFLLPSFVQSFKLAHDRKIAQKPLLALIFTAIVITFGMSVWMNVRLGYEHGGLQLNGWFAQGGAQQPAYRLSDLQSVQQEGSLAHWLWMGVGSSLTFLMMLARSRFAWFPLHPMGYLMCLTYPMAMLWFSIFLGWLCKVLIMHYGGRKAYREASPAFLGLALGDVVMMLLWLGVDGWQGRNFHQLMPG
jgi:hypothetical protein